MNIFTKKEYSKKLSETTKDKKKTTKEIKKKKDDIKSYSKNLKKNISKDFDMKLKLKRPLYKLR